MAGTPTPTTVSTKLQRIAKRAKDMPGVALRTLANAVDLEFLEEAYRRTRKSGAAGVDGQTAEEYAEDLYGNLQSLLDRFKSGTYRAPPVRGVEIPKGNGKTRPLGIPTFEDKVLQRAVCMLLTAVYEQDFMNCSHGFRPGRSTHGALETLWHGLKDRGVWVLEADIQGFFDNLDHEALKGFLDKRVSDGVIRRTIHKWLKAGVMKGGERLVRDTGTPQGGVISPLLANVYLHEVLDQWFELEIKPLLEEEATLVRYADDFVIAFSSERDARKVWAVLPKRFGKHGLTLHPEKTRLVNFRQGGKHGEEGGPSRTFDFLGFTHYWGLSRWGAGIPVRRTAKDRLRKAVTAVADWCRRNRHMRVKEQAAELSLKVRGHYGYYGITGNLESLKAYYLQVKRAWRGWLDRRSQRRSMPWARFDQLLERYPLPEPKVVRSIYRQRTSIAWSRMR